jgi:hypothetical protein
MRVRNPATGRIGSVVRGPYRKFNTEWYDVVFPNDFGEPGQYSQRCELRCLEILTDIPDE